jgi:hypothetical protein
MESDASRRQIQPPCAAIIAFDPALNETTRLEVIDEQADVGAVDTDPRRQSDLVETRFVAQEGKCCILQRGQIVSGETLRH